MVHVIKRFYTIYRQFNNSALLYWVDHDKYVNHTLVFHCFIILILIIFNLRLWSKCVFYAFSSFRRLKWLECVINSLFISDQTTQTPDWTCHHLYSPHPTWWRHTNTQHPPSIEYELEMLLWTCRFVLPHKPCLSAALSIPDHQTFVLRCCFVPITPRWPSWTNCGKTILVPLSIIWPMTHSSPAICLYAGQSSKQPVWMAAFSLCNST